MEFQGFSVTGPGGGHAPSFSAISTTPILQATPPFLLCMGLTEQIPGKTFEHVLRSSQAFHRPQQMLQPELARQLSLSYDYEQNLKRCYLRILKRKHQRQMKQYFYKGYSQQ